MQQYTQSLVALITYFIERVFFKSYHSASELLHLIGQVVLANFL